MPKKHPKCWDPVNHYMSIGGQCGQSCPCCRSQAGDILGSCPICNQKQQTRSIHPEGWNSKTHYMSIGGQCGQSCPCCRSQAGDKLGSCQICYQIKI